MPEHWSRRYRLLGPLLEDGVAQIRAQWRSHALTLVGIVWGATAVVLLLAYGAGFVGFMDEGFRKTGDRYLLVAPQFTTNEVGGGRPGRPLRLDRDDLVRVRAATPGALRVAAENQRPNAAVRTPRHTRGVVVSVASSELQHIKNLRVARGRFFSPEDERAGRALVVVGADLVEPFFGPLDPIGRTLQIEGKPFEVVGVLARKGSQFMTNNAPHDRMMWVPLEVGQRTFGLGDRVFSMLLELRDRGGASQVTREVRAALDPIHHLDPQDAEVIQTFDVPSLMATFSVIGTGLELLLLAMGALMLGMSGVGVANLMAAAVAARRSELAMRRACGARRSDLLIQLLVETVVVVFSGGILGIGVAVAILAAMQALPLPDSVPAPFVTTRVLVVTFGVLVAVGLVSGVAPARSAMRVDPAAALRSE